jgi:hypothetical protein
MQEILVALIVVAALGYLVWTWWPRPKKGDCGIDCSCGAQRIKPRYIPQRTKEG